MRKIYIIILIILSIVIINLFLVNKFNSNIWKYSWVEFKENTKNLDGVDSYSYLKNRHKMIPSLIFMKTIKDKNKYQIIDILGLENNNINTNRWVYWISFTASDNKWLVVEFDSKDIVCNIYTEED